MHHKRGRARRRRAGCKLCKPWKMNGVRTERRDGERFSDHRRRVVFEGGMQNLRQVPDLDGDGLDELVMNGSFGMGGSVESSFSLLSFHSGALVSTGSGLGNLG